MPGQQTLCLLRLLPRLLSIDFANEQQNSLAQSLPQTKPSCTDLLRTYEGSSRDSSKPSQQFPKAPFTVLQFVLTMGDKMLMRRWLRSEPQESTECCKKKWGSNSCSSLDLDVWDSLLGSGYLGLTACFLNLLSLFFFTHNTNDYSSFIKGKGSMDCRVYHGCKRKGVYCSEHCRPRMVGTNLAHLLVTVSMLLQRPAPPPRRTSGFPKDHTSWW